MTPSTYHLAPHLDLFVVGTSAYHLRLSLCSAALLCRLVLLPCHIIAPHPPLRPIRPLCDTQNSYIVLRDIEDRQLVGLSNWAVFRDHVKSVARSSGLNKYLNGTISAPAATATAANATLVVTPINSRNPTVEEWELRDARLAGIIYQNIKDPRSIGVTQDMTSHVMWTTLTGEYENTSAAAQALAKERVQQCKYVPGTPFEEYFKNLEGLRKAAVTKSDMSDTDIMVGISSVTAANDMGCNVMDTEIRARFLTSLSKEYLWILQNHGNRTYSELKKTLIEYDMMVQSTNPIKDSSHVPTALAATTRSAIICDNCKRVGHIRKNCWARGGGSEGKGPRWYNTPKGMEPLTSLDTTTAAVTTAAPSASVTAAITYDFCDTDPEGMDRPLHRTSNPDTSPDRLGPEAFALVSVSEVDVNSAQTTVLSVPTSNTIPTFIDSGASHWCIRNRARFVTYTTARSTGRLASEGTSGSFDVEGFGMAEITVKTEKGEQWIEKACGVLGVMDELKSSIQLLQKFLAGHRGGHGLYEVRVVDDLDNSLNQSYHTTPATNTFALAASGRSCSKSCSLEMWHTRFGHADINMIRIMAKRKTVEGLEVSDFTLCGKCEVCLLAKAKRKPFDDIVVPSSEPLDWISLDLWGPARTQSLGGARYMMLACDDGTGIPFPHFLPNKEASTVLGKVETFVAMAERQTGCKVRVIRIDMGHEFDNRTMDSWCAERGILIEKIPKASSAANGQVERANGTIIEGVRSMIEDSDLDHRVWAEAANSHCYIRGMIPTSRHPGVVPWEKWFEAKRARVKCILRMVQSLSLKPPSSIMRSVTSTSSMNFFLYTPRCLQTSHSIRSNLKQMTTLPS
ncbi:hypothetical protein D9757_011152 [Collybiopsis confluens]|uniref:Integrase catalytic domain-containing protein n=1 Tax=Collybiopsis confluens TaxID=2823264 RepID=A0A8H5M2L7_9AGAR|nr:hypothetical protein D9757_011152 [Collybiopsis confluens]